MASPPAVVSPSPPVVGGVSPSSAPAASPPAAILSAAAGFSSAATASAVGASGGWASCSAPSLAAPVPSPAGGAGWGSTTGSSAVGGAASGVVAGVGACWSRRKFQKPPNVRWVGVRSDDGMPLLVHPVQYGEQLVHARFALRQAQVDWAAVVQPEVRQHSQHRGPLAGAVLRCRRGRGFKDWASSPRPRPFPWSRRAGSHRRSSASSVGRVESRGATPLNKSSPTDTPT